MPIDHRLLRRITRTFLVEMVDRTEFDLVIYIVGDAAMTHLNETFLHHHGTTDVITFDYRDANHPQVVHGEIFICLSVAMQQAQRFRTTWQSELVRYVVHAILHLCDYDDRTPAQRGIMKQEEDRGLKELSIRYHFNKLGGHSTVKPGISGGGRSGPEARAAKGSPGMKTGPQASGSASCFPPALHRQPSTLNV